MHPQGPSAVPTPTHAPLPVVLIWSQVTWHAGLTRMVLGGDPTAALVEYGDAQQLATGNITRNTSDGRGGCSSERIPSRHHCLACLVRDDLLPHLAQLAATSSYGSVACVLPTPLELGDVLDVLPDAALDGRPVSGLVAIENIVAVIDAPGLAGATGVGAVGAGDGRGAGSLSRQVFSHLACADLIVLDRYDLLSHRARGRLEGLLNGLNGHALRLVLSTGGGGVTGSRPARPRALATSRPGLG